MAIDFPNSPTEGQTTTISNVTYTFTNGAWLATPVKTALPTNLITNGSFQTSQQNGNTAGTASGTYYAADSWNFGYAGAAVCTVQRVQVKTPSGSANRLRMTVSTADAALVTTDHFHFYHRIEGTRMSALAWGIGGVFDSPGVARFGFKGPAGTYAFRIGNAAGDYSYIKNFVVGAAQANTDTEQVIAIPIPPAGTWNTIYGNTAFSAQISIGVAWGPTYVGVEGWQSGALYGTSANTNGLATVGNVFEIFDVGLYADALLTSKPPSWQIDEEGLSMSQAMRYWVRSPALNGISTAATSMGRSGHALPVTMRATPAQSVLGAPTVYDVGANNAMGAVSTHYPTPYTAEIDAAATGLTVGRGAMMIGSMTACIVSNARL